MPELGKDLEKEKIFAAASAYTERARVVPYVLGLDGNPNKLLRENKGNCTRKHLYIASRLIQLGYKVQLGLATFDWTHLPIPKEITSILKDPIDTHMFLYATFSGKESLVDVTWDPGMPPGFPGDRWNGRSSMNLGVRPIQIWRQDIPAFQRKALAGKTIVLLREMTFGKDPTPFNDAFNAWIGRPLKSLHLEASPFQA